MTTYNVLHLNFAIASMSGIPAGSQTCITSLRQNIRRIASSSSIGMVKVLSDKEGLKHTHLTNFAINLAETIKFVQQIPQANGQMQVCLPPLIENFKNLGLPWFNQDQAINPQFFQESISRFQFNVQTSGFDEANEAWLTVSKRAAQDFDKCFKTLSKNTRGFDLYELLISTPLNPDLMPSLMVSTQTKFNQTLDKEILQLICKNEINQICAVLCKSEVNINQQYVSRFIIAVQCEYINDYQDIADSSFVDEIRTLIQSYNASQVYFQPCKLNGFLRNNRFMKESPTLKAQIKLLKTYLIGTDTLIRIHPQQPSCRILYTKFKD